MPVLCRMVLIAPPPRYRSALAFLLSFDGRRAGGQEPHCSHKPLVLDGHMQEGRRLLRSRSWGRGGAQVQSLN